MGRFGRTCDVSAEDVAKWFEADTLYPDVTLDEVLKNTWIVVHEIVEIDAVKKAGLILARDVIVANPEEVDRANHEAATNRVENCSGKEGRCALEGQDSGHPKLEQGSPSSARDES